MAVALTNQNTWYDVVASSQIYTAFSGYTLYWYNVIQARWTSVSGNTYSMQYRCVLRKSSGSLSTNTSSYNGYSIWGTGANTVSASNVTINFPNTGDNVIATTSGSLTGTSGTVTGGVVLGYWGDTWGSDSMSGSFTLPATSSAPVGLTGDNLVALEDGFSATVSITDWGIGGTTAQRYKELQCWTYDASTLQQPRRFNGVAENTLSSTITVNNTSDYTATSGALNIVGNTRYTLGLYATNGAANTGHVRWRDAVTLAYKPEVHVQDVTKTTATFVVHLRADGGFYEKTLYYSLDNGTNWIPFETNISGDETTTSFEVIGLTPGTSYTIKVGVGTEAGENIANDTTFYTSVQTPTFYTSNSLSRAEEVIPFYGSNGSTAQNIIKMYGSMNGQAALVFDNSKKRTS